MFDSLFPKEWTTLQRLMWLKTNALARAVYEIVTGNPVTFTAKKAPLRQLKVAFSPVQSLNGYDAPWPAGGGANKFDESTVTLGKWFDSSGGLVSSGNAVVGDYIPVSGASVVSAKFYGDVPLALNIVEYASDNSFVKRNGWYTSQTSASVTLDESTAYVRLGAALDNITMTTDTLKAFKLMFVLSATLPATYSPYSNECPISGWSSLTVEQTGKNLFDVAHNKKNLYVGGGSGRTTGNDGVLLCFSLKKGAKYTLRAPTGRDRNGLFYTDSPISDIVSGFTFDGGGGVAEVYTFEAEYNTYAYYANATWSDTIGNDFIVCLGEEAPAEYVPYNPSTRSISINLGSTVYSGYVDVVTGVVTVTHGFHVCDGTDGWFDDVGTATTADGTAYVAYITKNAAKNMKNTGICPSMASNFAYNEVANLNLHKGQFNTTGSYFRFVLVDPSVTSLALWNAWLANNPIQLVYELATPIHIQLTPQEVESLAGDNTMWSNANQPITVEYRKN